jgi:hypothetical protein
MKLRVPIVPYPRPEVLEPRPLPARLRGVVLGLLNNQKPNATELLAAILGRLEHVAPPARVVRGIKSQPIPAPTDVITTLAGGADMTLIASAD